MWLFDIVVWEQCRQHGISYSSNSRLSAAKTLMYVCSYFIISSDIPSCFIFVIEFSGAVMFAPMVNPYDPRLTKDERRKIWGRWTAKRKMMYLLARKFPKVLAYFYGRSFLSGDHGRFDRWLSLSLGKKVHPIKG